MDFLNNLTAKFTKIQLQIYILTFYYKIIRPNSQFKINYFRLDQTLGKPVGIVNGKKSHSSTISSRLTRLELQVSTIDRKMDNCTR
jgi:hypothetical protein